MKKTFISDNILSIKGSFRDCHFIKLWINFNYIVTKKDWIF